MHGKNSDIIIQIEDETNYFDILPAELLAQIFSHLNEEAIAQTSQVCKRFFFTIINQADLILYDRLSRELLTLPMSKQLLLHSLFYWDISNKDELTAPDLPVLLKDKR